NSTHQLCVDRVLERRDSRRLGETLREFLVLDDHDVEQAATVAKATGKRIGEVLEETGLITPEQKQRALGHQWGIPFIDLTDYEFDENAIRSVPERMLKEHKVIPLKLEGKDLALAITDPLNVRAIDEIRLTTGFDVEAFIAVEEQVLAALDHYLGLDATDVAGLTESTAKEAEGIEVEAPASPEEETEDLRLDEDEPVIVRLVSLILAGGTGKGASDIHVQPEERALRIRYRVDGVLYDAPSHSWRYGKALTARLKVMAQMDIAEKRRPQDGRISFNCGGKRYGLRVSCLPGVYGEKIVMRIAEHGRAAVPLHKLGFAEDQLKRFEELILRPYGMILVTGPTGSGKTTTLYSVLERLNSPEKNILTVEDPVERRIAGVTQVQVGSASRSPMTFATALRYVLRQDPNIIMVGELRDHDTALIATEASLTGHLVLSTLHTNDAPGAGPRLLEMGVEPFLVSSSLLGVLAQRLVRVLCPKCREAYDLPPGAVERLRLPVGTGDGALTAYKAKGCPACDGKGYKGRLGVFELLVVTDDIRRLILARAPAVEIANVAREQGMVTMLQDATSKVLRGVTSMAEALRVVDTQ
ncbi:MAG: type II/IV secretion system protein, partial [Planctomycetes bacterium]|nr:type II/IV secretion system protein [Planctomycetota bacterium]